MIDSLVKLILCDGWSCILRKHIDSSLFWNSKF